MSQTETRVEPAIALDQVACRFGNGDSAYQAIAPTSLSVAAGEFVSIVGPTGSGKSTLLNLAAGLISPSSGSVRIFGERLVGINRRAGYLFQADALLPWRTALANVGLGLEYRRVPAAEIRERGEAWLERVGLKGMGQRYPHQLSGGQRKRVALAQTLITGPDLLLMDEPFGALDVQTRQVMENELLALWAAERRSVLFITHDLEEAIALSDRVLLLSAGPGARLIADLPIRLPRPRDVAEIRLTPEFLDLHRTLWAALKAEVMKAYGGPRP